jgi:hypothetical protein
MVEPFYRSTARGSGLSRLIKDRTPWFFGDVAASHPVLHQVVSCLFSVLTYDNPLEYNSTIE